MITNLLKRFNWSKSPKIKQKKENQIKLKRSAGNFKKIQEIHSSIASDELGGSSLGKVYLMSYLAKTKHLTRFVEIGVYRGKSFIPTAKTIFENGGYSYGIDPYKSIEAMEDDIKDEKLKKRINELIRKHDFNNTYKSVLRKIRKTSIAKRTKLIKKKSSEACKYISEIDLLHIDGNHDKKHVSQDAKNFIKLVRDNGFIVFDDIDWPSVSETYKEWKEKLVCIYKSTDFAILWKVKKNELNHISAKLLGRKLSEIHTRINSIENGEKKEKYKVAVGLLTYNHEHYILECLKGICNQNHEISSLKIVICDDASTDKTIDIATEFLLKQNIDYEIHKNRNNVGLFPNFQKLLAHCSGYDYVAFCEGDDSWPDSEFINKQIYFLKNNPECSLVGNSINYIDECSGFISSFDPLIVGDIFDTSNLIANNFIGNLSASFHTGKNITNLDPNLKGIEMGDWFFNIISSFNGDIGYNRNTLTNYRQHGNSYWSSMESLKKCRTLITYINKYNKYLDYQFDNIFQSVINGCRLKINNSYVEDLDLLIIDDAFPSPRSGFRLIELGEYIKRYDKSLIISNGFAVKILGSKTIDELIIDYKRKNTFLAHKIEKFEHWNHRSVQLAYMVFLGNIAMYLELLELHKIPFIFELYPGGSFQINDPDTDATLKRVFGSPMFRSVIVTQKNILEYITSMKFCDPKKIKYIFGVVAPEINYLNTVDKKYYALHKGTLDICFVAHRYTERGIDKGYDTFIEVAKILSKDNLNIHFHIVGNFNESDIDINVIKPNITFYGLLDIDKFDDFYLNKDIMLSPNRPFLNQKGAFDGFPTAAATDAGLRKTAVFCTDELNLNNGVFTTGIDIEIIKSDVKQIVEKIKYYYANPELLRKLCDNTAAKMQEVYSLKNQMTPRFEIIDQTLAAITK